MFVKLIIVRVLKVWLENYKRKRKKDEEEAEQDTLK